MTEEYKNKKNRINLNRTINDKEIFNSIVKILGNDRGRIVDTAYYEPTTELGRTNIVCDRFLVVDKEKVYSSHFKIGEADITGICESKYGCGIQAKEYRDNNSEDVICQIKFQYLKSELEQNYYFGSQDLQEFIERLDDSKFDFIDDDFIKETAREYINKAPVKKLKKY